MFRAQYHAVTGDSKKGGGREIFMKTEVLSVRINGDLKAMLNRDAKRGRISTSELVNRIIEKAFDKDDHVSILYKAITSLQAPLQRLEESNSLGLIVMETLVRYILLVSPDITQSEVDKRSRLVASRFASFLDDVLARARSGGLIIETINAAIIKESKASRVGDPYSTKKEERSDE